MGGLIALLVIALWLALCVYLARRIPHWLGMQRLRRVATVVLVPVLLVLPVMDEVIGGFQFRALCRENAVFKVDAEKIKGKTIGIVIEPLNKNVDNTIVRIYYSHHSYRDIETQEELASFNDYTADGGWFFRSLAGGNPTSPLVPMTKNPVTLNASNSCTHYETQESLAARYGFTFIKTSEKTK